MSTRVLDIDDLLEEPDNPRFIAGVFNYCDRRCGRCQFSDRCRLYADEQRDLEQHPADDWTTRVERSLERTIELVRQFCRREGIDFEGLSADAHEEDVAAENRLFDEARQDPLLKLAEQYTGASTKLSQRLRRAELFNSWPLEAHEAVETIEWFSMRVSSKLHRALTGYARQSREDEANDPVQSDWNGSAKVARLEIAQSRTAWNQLLAVGQAPADSPLRQMPDLLDQIEAGIAERFPRAMEFVRPGFDDPELQPASL